MKQFGRKWQLSIFSQKDAIIIHNLKISFDITKNTDSAPNEGEIRVWNLDKSKVERALNGEYKNLTLSVGYGEPCLIFKGDITKTRVERDGVDTVLRFSCADGFRAFAESRIMMTLPRGADDGEILKQLGGTFKNVMLGEVATPNKTKLPRGKVLNGDTRTLLNNLAKNNNADWSIQDGALVFIPKNQVLSGASFLISQSSGLVGTPEKTDTGLSLTCLLNPQLKIGAAVEVQSIFPAFNGFYKIIKINHNGTGGDGEWLSKIDVVRGDFKKIKGAINEL